MGGPASSGEVPPGTGTPRPGVAAVQPRRHVSESFFASVSRRRWTFLPPRPNTDVEATPAAVAQGQEQGTFHTGSAPGGGGCLSLCPPRVSDISSREPPQSRRGGLGAGRRRPCARGKNREGLVASGDDGHTGQGEVGVTREGGRGDRWQEETAAWTVVRPCPRAQPHSGNASTFRL